MCVDFFLLFFCSSVLLFFCSFLCFQCCKNVDAMDDESRGRLDVKGEFHLGDMVNVIQHGSLVMQQTTTNTNNADGDQHITVARA